MNCFLFIFMITLTVATINPVDGVSCEENVKSLKEDNKKIHGKYNELNADFSALKGEYHELQNNYANLQQEVKETKTTLEEATTKNNALNSSNEQCETENQALKRQLRPRDCADIYAGGVTNDGVYTIYPDNSPMQVYCEMSQTQGSIVIQKRYDGSLDYARMFQEYSDGFGDLKAEHWLGLSLMNRITATGRWKLRVELVNVKNEARYAEYSDFKIGPAPGFQLLLDRYSYKGDAGDWLGYHHNMKFTARDMDQDRRSDRNCSAFHGRNAGWWFNECYYVITTRSCNILDYPGRAIQWAGYYKSATLKIKKF